MENEDKNQNNLPVVWVQPTDKDYQHYNQHTVSMILRSLARGSTIQAACGAARIGKSTYFRWRQDIPDFKELTDNAIAFSRSFVEDQLWKLIELGDGASIRFFLTTRHGKDFQRPPSTIVNQKNMTTINHNYADAMKKARQRAYDRTHRSEAPRNSD